MPHGRDDLSAELSARVCNGCLRLGPEARCEVARFVREQWRGDGGFCGRARAGSDLYYTVFGLECARALKLPLAWNDVAAYLDRQTTAVATLDLVHLSCLIRAWSIVASVDPVAADRAAAQCPRLEAFRGADGGYASRAAGGTTHGEIYALFLAGLAYGAAKLALPAPKRAGRTVLKLATPDGAFANHPAVPNGTTTVTAAAVVMFAAAGVKVPARTRDWLLARQDASGGFRAGSQAPVPDLLSTATALLALTALGIRLPADCATRCAAFVESLWDESGGFCGSPPDPVPDLEYTYYALMSLGCLR